MSLKPLNALIFGALCASASITAQAAPLVFNTVALTGQTAPGTNAQYSSFQAPGINDQGDIAFRGFLGGGGVDNSNNSGLWSTTSGSLELLAREGDSAPGTTAQYGHISSFTMNNNGTVGLFANLTGPDVTNSNAWGSWTISTGTTELLVRTGDAAPGTTAQYANVSAPLLNDDGSAIISTRLTGPGVTNENANAFFTNRSGAMELLWRHGDPAPGTDASFQSGNLVRNDGGDIALRGTLTGGSVTSDNLLGIWSDTGSGLELIARTGDAAPGTAGQFSGLNVPDINDDGAIVVGANLSGAGINNSNDFGIWTGDSNGLGLLVREGDAAPGTGNHFAGFSTPDMNDNGDVAFRGLLGGSGVDNSNVEGIWSTVGGGLDLVARRGEVAPGTSAMFHDILNPVLTNSGQAIFYGSLRGDEVNGSNFRGLWMQDPSGDLIKVARMGDLFDVGGGIMKTISNVATLLNVSGGFANGFAADGSLGLHLNFTDGSHGIFTSSFETQTGGPDTGVPEPGALLLSGLGVVALFSRRRVSR